MEKASEQDKFILRLPNGMRERLKDEASKQGRSMNAEVVERLQETLNNLSIYEVLEEQNRKMKFQEDLLIGQAASLKSVGVALQHLNKNIAAVYAHIDGDRELSEKIQRMGIEEYYQSLSGDFDFETR